jgi:hypothetical protein
MAKENQTDELATVRAELAEMKAALAATQKTAALLSEDSVRVKSEERRSKWDQWFESCRAISSLPVAERVEALRKADGPSVTRVLQFLDVATLADTLDACGKDRNRIRRHIESSTRSGALIELEIKIHRAPAVARVRVTLKDESGALQTTPIEAPRKSDRCPGMRFCGPKNQTGALGATEKVMPLSLWEKYLAIDPELRLYVEGGALVVTPLSDDESKKLSFREISENMAKNIELAARGWMPGESIEAVGGTEIAENNGFGIETDHVAATRAEKR